MGILNLSGKGNVVLFGMLEVGSESGYFLMSSLKVVLGSVEGGLHLNGVTLDGVYACTDGVTIDVVVKGGYEDVAGES